MLNTKVILISGKARNGKDQSAAYIAERLRENGDTVMVFHFADPLKMICETQYGWIRGDKGPIGRTILQNVGAMYRKNSPNCWVNVANEIISGCDAKYVIIPDCRYPNEIDGVLADKIAVRIIRPEFDNGLTPEQKEHSSETSLDSYNFDYIIMNEGDLPALKKKIDEFCKEIEKW